MASNGTAATGFWGELWQLTRAVSRAMGVTFRNLFRRPVTVMYPDTSRPYPDRFRGVLALVYEKVEPKEAVALWERYIELAGSLPSEKDWMDVARLHLRKLKNQLDKSN